MLCVIKCPLCGKNKVAIITGSAGGIGTAITELLAKEGAILVLVESSAAGQLSESLDELGGEEFTHSLSDQIVEQILAEEEESRE